MSVTGEASGDNLEFAHKLAAEARRARLNLLIANLTTQSDCNRQLETALSKYCQAIEAAPTEIGPYLELAELCFQNDLNEQAIDVCTEAIEQDPQCWRAFQQRALAYSHLELRDEAIDDCDAAVQINKSVQTLHTRADVYSWFEEYANAVKDCDEAVALGPEQAECFSKRSRLLAEWFCEAEVDELLRRAIADETRAIMLEPGNTDFIRSRGRSYLDLRLYQESITDLSKCVEIEPEYYLNYEIRGEAYLKDAQPVLAIKDLTRAIELNPESSYSYEFRAKAYRMVGRLPEADEDEARWRQLDCVDQ